MRFRKLIRSRWTAFVVLGLSGCSAGTAPPPIMPADQPATQSERPKAPSDSLKELKMTETAPKTLTISKFKDGDWVQLGVLDFDDKNQGTLSFSGSGPIYDQLEQDWYAISDEPELLWKRSVPREEDGETVMRAAAAMVRPDDERYIYAVFNTLERSYGYRVAFGK